MLVRDIVKFNRENYYNGAIQTEWFYDDDRVDGIARSYVFHGPKYYGVTSKDVAAGEHKLLDTASFTKIVSDKILNKADNNFLLTIAGYGTGKSHLAVTLGSLFSGNTKLRSAVISNLRSIDSDIADSIEKNDKRNLVIALNGMRNFNLDSEVLRCVRMELEKDGISDDVLKGLTKTYDVARYFVSSNFERCKEDFENAAKEQGLSYTGKGLQDYIIDNLEADSRALNVVNAVYLIVTGDSLHWDQGISAGDVITVACDKLCGNDKPYNKVLVLFDEFGRYIEYVAANPTIAGDASLQQIFEAIQTANGKAIFVGFIQYELEAYLSHIDKTANVIRYVGRYSVSEKYYLSSNFETILANLLEKNKDGSFDRVIGRSLDRYENYHAKVKNAMKRWSGVKSLKNVWESEGLYRSIIMEGCFPMHPMTVWLLSNSSGWMQQRSTIAFCADMYDAVAENEIVDDWLPYVYPVDIVDSGIYSEMLSSEEKGLVKSQHCMLYNEICVKVGDKLNVTEQQLLKAILITRIAGFSFYDKEDACLAFRYCSNLKEEEIKPALKNLEDRHGIIAYDDQAGTYDLIAEANGFNEFKRVYARYRTGKPVDIEEADEDVLKSLMLLDPVDTAFGQENHISSIEWKFEKHLLNSTSITEGFLNAQIATLNAATSGDDVRGSLIYAYCSEDSESEAKRLVELAKQTGIDKTPIIILLLDDADGEIVKALTIKSTLNRFSVSDCERFSKHILSQKRKQDKAIIQKFNELVMERQMISEDGVRSYDKRLNALCTERFSEVYSTPVPFAFDGFENYKSAQAKKTFATICIKLFDQTLMNIQSYQALNTADKNRVQTCISVGSKYSWQVFNDSCQLVVPQNELLRKMFNEVDQAISDDGSYTVGRLFGKYLHAPYGMNAYSLTLFVIYFVQKQGNKLLCFLGNDRLNSQNLSNSILKDGKLKFSELQRVTIRKNLNADVDMVAELCNEILENTDVEKCGLLRSRLDKVILAEGENGKNQMLIGQAKMRLDDGETISNKLAEKTDKIKQFLDDANAKLVIHKFIGVFEYVDEPSGIIEDGLPYVYGQDYIDTINTARKRIKNLMGETYSNALGALRCSDIIQLGSLQNTYKRVVKILTENGFKEQATAAEQRVLQIVEETKAKNQYNQALGEFEKEFALFGDVSKIDYGECLDRIAKFEGWKKFFEDADMPKSIKEPLIEKTQHICRKIEERETELINAVSHAEAEIDTAATLDDLADIRDNLEEYSGYHFEDDVTNRIEAKIKEIDSICAKIEDIPDSIDEIETLIGDVRCENTYDRVYLNELNVEKEKLISDEQLWIAKNLLPAEDVTDLNAQQCTAFIEKLQNVPAYSSKKTVQRVQNAISAIEGKLHECKVQGVLSLFNALSEEEKDEFLRLIEQR